eukprot:s11035_g1.t1
MKAQMPPGTSFTTIALNFNTPMQCHKDSNNRPGEKAFLMGFGNYVGGGLWCHEDNAGQAVVWKQFRGRWLPGRIYHTYHNLVCFDPCRFHQPQPWEGKRITISAYTVNCYDNCSQAHLALLQALGFPLPHDGVRAQPEGGEDSSVPGEDQTLESPQVAGGEGRDLVQEGQGHVGDRAVPGEDQTLESPQVAGGEGRGCMCKGYEVDPSLCVCKGYEVDPSPKHGPQVFYIGDAVSANVEDGTKDQVEGEPEDAWLREEWGAYGPPELARLMALNEEDKSSYHLVGAESPLRVGWDLLGEYVDGLRMALENEDVAEFVRAAQVIAGEIQWLAGRCRPELMYATNLLSQAISRCPKEAVYRGGHLVRYLKRYPKGGLVYSSQPVKEKDARLSCRGPLLEGYSDASFAPSAERSQQCVLVFASGGLVAWCSSRQPFVTMSTAESELVAICEMTTCLKSLEQLAAEVGLVFIPAAVFLGKASDFVKVMKVLFSDSQSALSVCRCAAGSWRTRHLRIRGNLVRELLDQADWTSFHLDGVTMTADIGTKALPADRFGMLMDRMRMTRTRCTMAEAREVKTLNPQCARRLVLLLCLASLVDQVEAADAEQVDYVYYGFLTGVVVVILIVYEFIKWGLQEVRGWCRVRGEATRIKKARPTTTTTRARPPTSSSSSSTSASEEMMSLRRRRPPTPPVPEDRVMPDDEGAYSFITPSGDRDRWEVDYEREVAIRWHAKPRQHLFVPGHCSGGPELSRLTGERTTYAKFASGQVRMLKDNYLQLAKPSPVLADREWKGRTELKMHPAVKATTKGKMR